MKIKVLRTDNGGEFCGNEFKEFCKKCIITSKNTTPYTPQHNGAAERMNRTPIENAILDLIHCYVFGIVHVTSLGKFVHYV